MLAPSLVNHNFFFLFNLIIAESVAGVRGSNPFRISADKIVKMPFSINKMHKHLL